MKFVEETEKDESNVEITNKIDEMQQKIINIILNIKDLKKLKVVYQFILGYLK